MKRATLFIVITLTSVFSFAQDDFDIATVLSYNILNYRNNFAQCNSSTNNAQNKEQNLATIIEHVDPDIVCYQEVSSSSLTVLSNLLNNTLNTNGTTKYDIASTQGSSNLMNAVYYNSEMFTHYSSEQIRRDLSNLSLVRLIDVVTFYHNDPSLSETFDTTFLTVFVAHLKAGNSNSDEAERARATATIMDYLDNHSEIENYLLAGDLNVYSGNGDAFSNLINGSRRFYDPIDAVGNWSNSSSFSFAHTQSTRRNQTSGGCFSGGGMDDRFDFILISDDVRSGSNRVKYINRSYEALGQDGGRFNESINFPSNSSEPTEIIDALYEVSDHLPIIMDLQMIYSAPVGISEVSRYQNFSASIQGEVIRILNQSNQPFNGDIRMVDLTGRTIYSSSSVTIESNSAFQPAIQVGNGIYIVQMIDSNGKASTFRFYKN
jgi:endonuclease/exonuclease/phosphatase family metal-dependent hydrolase